VSDHKLNPSELAKLRTTSLSRPKGEKYVDLKQVTDEEKHMVDFFSKDSAKKQAAVPKANSGPPAPAFAPGSPRGARLGLSALSLSDRIPPASPRATGPCFSALSPPLATSPGSPGSPKPEWWSPDPAMDWRNW